jgi:hypothetical protein
LQANFATRLTVCALSSSGDIGTKHCYRWLMFKLPRLARAVFFALAFCAGTADVQASSIKLMKTLQLMVLDPAQADGMQLMGTVGAYLKKLKKAGHRCELSTYEYGGSIDCQTRPGKRVLIDLADDPTHAPEFAQAVVRPDGINSKEISGPDVVPFLKSLVTVSP